MSDSRQQRQLSQNPAFAAYMASVFTSAARTHAHDADFIAGRMRVLHAVGKVDQELVIEVRALARRARSLEEKAGEACQNSHRAEHLRMPYDTVAHFTSTALDHRLKAEDVVKRSSDLERRVIGRWRALSGGGQTLSFVALWSLPARGRVRLISELRSSSDATLPRPIATWAGSAEARDQILLYSNAGKAIIQVARPVHHREIWPWTVRVMASPPESKLPDGVVSVLSKGRFVDHGGPALWCHVAPRRAEALGRWVVAVLDAVTSSS